MSLTSSLQIGRTALTASQLAIQVTGNNFANAATPGYNRQTVDLAGLRDSRQGQYFVGRGVGTLGVSRQVDDALLARLITSVSDERAASTSLGIYATVESTLNELSDFDLSSEMSRFFNAWSELANSPGSQGTRSLVVQRGDALANSFQTIRSGLSRVQRQTEDQLRATVSRGDELLSEIASLNAEIVTAEVGTAVSNSLRDQRDSLVRELAELVEVSTNEQASGALDVFVGSFPVVTGNRSRGLEVETESTASGVELSVRTRDDGTNLRIRSGEIGALVEARTEAVEGTLTALDDLAAQMIFSVNRVHSEGRGSVGATSFDGDRRVATGDEVLSLNDPANASFAGLPFAAENGGFFVVVRDTATGTESRVRVDVDLDGIDSTGAAGFGDDSSVASITADLNGIANVSAVVNGDGTVSITAASGFEIAFEEDSSGALALLGINTYFSGEDAASIGVRQELVDRPELLGTGRTVRETLPDGTVTTTLNDNATALAIVGLEDAANANLGGQSIRGAWAAEVQRVAINTDSALTDADSTRLVRESLDSQREGVSGVSVDEESINLITYQRQFQGAARFISVVDELTEILLSLV